MWWYFRKGINLEGDLKYKVEMSSKATKEDVEKVEGNKKLFDVNDKNIYIINNCTMCDKHIKSKRRVQCQNFSLWENWLRYSRLFCKEDKKDLFVKEKEKP